MKYFLFLFIVMASCNQVIRENKEVIKATLNAHAATKSLKIKDYKVEDYLDRPDTLVVFVHGHFSNDDVFNDTLRYAKTGDAIIISHE